MSTDRAIASVDGIFWEGIVQRDFILNCTAVTRRFMCGSFVRILHRPDGKVKWAGFPEGSHIAESIGELMERKNV